MIGIEINPALCTGCGACVKDCLPQNLSLENGKAVVGGPCFMCGHCIAVCPVGAPVSVDSRYSMDDVQPVTPPPAASTVLAAVKRRRSIRRFQPKPVERDVMAQILEAARFTESNGNRQELQYTVIQAEFDAAKAKLWDSWHELEEKGGLGKYQSSEFVRGFYPRHLQDPADDALFFNASTLLIVTGYDSLTAGLALANMEQMAQSFGIGLIHMGFLRMAVQNCNELTEQFVQKDRQVLACVLMGYPEAEYQRTTPRKPLVIQWH